MHFLSEALVKTTDKWVSDKEKELRKNSWELNVILYTIYKIR